MTRATVDFSAEVNCRVPCVRGVWRAVEWDETLLVACVGVVESLRIAWNRFGCRGAFRGKCCSEAVCTASEGIQGNMFRVERSVK